MTKVAGVDLSKLSLEQLNELVPTAQQRIEELQEKQRRKAFQKMEAAAAEVGMTPKELIKHVAKLERQEKKPKYQNPDNPDESWSGRGRKPAWVEAWLESGKDLKELEAK
jgi:DNA-binding protein H-NS